MKELRVNKSGDIGLMKEGIRGCKKRNYGVKKGNKGL